MLFYALAVNYAGVKTKSAAHAYVSARYLSFQLLQIFVTVASGSVLAVARDFLDHPKSVLDLMGKALPGMGRGPRGTDPGGSHRGLAGLRAARH